ncbi:MULTISPECIES: CDP-glycerol glycerophosphotransferase family protein [Pseudomonas]|jgi:CDP-glycerol glycerophosphotransferase|uniref:CDP-glycerol glycerophosphotransferase family protein n=1 Tax=Pseudomonas TaxID=286 RepID=UPI0009E5E0F6|nr:CDP-glycerol glycerophosphotransferase family protein [Pseudomonas sp. PI1]
MPETWESALSLEEQVALLERSELFDAQAYLRDNPEIAGLDLSPLEHFCRQGWRELRDPSPGFNLWWYWIKHLGGDVAAPNPALHYAVVGRAQGLTHAAPDGGFASTAEKAAFNLASMALLRSLPADAETYARITRSLGRLGAWDLAEIAGDKAVCADPENAGHLHLLGTVLLTRQTWWRACEVLADAVRLDPTHADRFACLGDAHMKMGRSVEAAEAYRRALRLTPDDAQLHHRLGIALAKAGNAGDASESFRRAVALDARDDVQRFGLGVLYQERGDWSQAASAFAELASARGDGEAHYRHGFALEHCYRWEEALTAYRLALQAQDRPEWHYRSGLVLERLGQYDEAAQAYAQALNTHEQPAADWHYRHGYALYCNADHRGACDAWLQVCDRNAGLPAQPLQNPEQIRHELAEQGSDAERYFRLGACCEHAGDWQDAVEAYEAAIARSNTHAPNWYYRLGVVLIEAGRLREACEAFAETRLFKRPSLIEADAQDAWQEFAEFVATLPLRRRVVMYESFAGQTMGCNPLALFRHLLRQPDHAGWLHVWAIRHADSVPQAYRRMPNVIIVEHGSSLYRRYLATAEYLINNFCFPDYFIRRGEQSYLNTWHGTPLECLGQDAQGAFLAYGNIARNFLQATHLISPGAHASHGLFESYAVANLFSAQLAETGNPRIDAVLAGPEIRRTLRRRLNLDDRPAVLYAPTWQGADTLAPILDTLDGLARGDYHLIFHGHPSVEQAILRKALPVTVAPSDINSSELLSIADALITDHPGLCLDFLPTRRPVLRYLHEQDGHRPPSLAEGEMPGTLCRDLAALRQALAEQLANGCLFDGRYRDALARFCPHEDGRSSERAAAFFFEGSQARRVARAQRQSLLFHVGAFAPNGITTSALNLLAALDEGGDTLALTVDPWALESFPARREKLALLPQGACILPRAGGMVLTAEEQWLIARFNARHDVDDASIWPMLEQAYRREFHRLFGDTRFTAVIDFSGYNPYWSSLFALGTGEERKLVYLHADMREQQRDRYPALLTQFRLYSRFDAVVSVSPALSAAHRTELAEAFGIAPSRFVACGNMLDTRMILSRANEPLDADLAPWFDGGATFLALGRLSPEKDQGKLIRAFAVVAMEFPPARLVIAGEGPLKRNLTELVDGLGLQDAVLLAGQRNNPFALLAHCACCVLPSNHEGQPMVLLEAMVLQRPIIATDIEANRAVLAETYGSLAPNSETGLAQAMREFLLTGQAVRHFDADAYRQAALANFDKLLARKPPHA